MNISRTTYDAVSRFEETRKMLVEFLADNKATFDVYAKFVDEFNATLAAAKASVKEVPGTEKFSVGPFTRSASNPLDSYDPTKLSASVLSIPGVVKAVDTEKIKQLVADGEIPFSDVKDAKITVMSTSKINGPKPLETL